jgi:hypothetical protein
MGKILLGTGVIIGVVGLVIVLSLLFAWPTLWVINYLVAPTALKAVFGISQLTFWKAFWLNFICGNLFKNPSTTSSSK